ncbi:MAG: extracellular solute-binding protein [Candidatus Limiplasma sp.]|nr:extracellular solute-binding protein [Candidatus Limiplasma sp.]
MKRKLSLCIAALLILLLMVPLAQAEDKTLVIWSHWADETNKKEFVQTAVDHFLAKNPDFKVEINWQQKDALITALNAAMPAGEGPDIFYLEPVITGAFPNFFDAGYMLDLTPYLGDSIADGAMGFAQRDGQIYLLPVEAYTPLMYINKGVFEKAGLPTDQTAFDTAAFAGALGKIKEAGFGGLAAGTMDRTWCASIVIDVALLRTLGVEKWDKLRTGETAWTDPDVRKALEFVDGLVKAGYYPEGVGSIKLGESHGIFFSGEYGMFPMKTFFAGRAFVPVESGGMAEDFPLGIMDMPTFEGGPANQVNYLQVGGSYGVNVDSAYPEKAAELLAEMGTPEMASLWMSKVMGQTGIKGGSAPADNQYLKDLNQVLDTLTLVPGPLTLGMDREYLNAYENMTTLLVIGEISVDDLIANLEEARAKVAP